LAVDFDLEVETVWSSLEREEYDLNANPEGRLK
jgi:hypothetical protein